MSIASFFSALAAPSIERNRLVFAYEEAMRKMENLTIKVMQLQDAPYKDQRLYQSLDRTLRSQYGPQGYRGNQNAFIIGTIMRLLKEKSNIVRIIENTFNKNIDVDGLSYEKAHLIQYVSAVIFFNEYTLRYSYAITGRAVGNIYRKQGTIDDYESFCGDLENARTYAICLGALNYNASDLSKALKPLKDIPFNPEVHDSIALIRKGSIDPLKMNMVPIAGHAALLIGEMINGYSEWSYKLAESQVETAQLNLIYLDRAKAGASAEELAEIEDKIMKWRGVVSKNEGRMAAIKEG